MRKMFIAAVAVVALAVGTFNGNAHAQTVPTAGEVTKIDQSAEKITIRHEPIKNLDMDGMNMVFRVKDPAMLTAVQVGDKIIFEADRVNGALTVVSLKKSE